MPYYPSWTMSLHCFNACYVNQAIITCQQHLGMKYDDILPRSFSYLVWTNTRNYFIACHTPMQSSLLLLGLLPPFTPEKQDEISLNGYLAYQCSNYSSHHFLNRFRQLLYYPTDLPCFHICHFRESPGRATSSSALGQLWRNSQMFFWAFMAKPIFVLLSNVLQFYLE